MVDDPPLDPEEPEVPDERGTIAHSPVNTAMLQIPDRGVTLKVRYTPLSVTDVTLRVPELAAELTLSFALTKRISPAFTEFKKSI